VEYQENLPLSQEYVCPVGSFIFCPTVKIEIQSPVALRFDYYESRSFYLFFDYKEILSKFTFAIVAFRNFFF
jgi:hypothetical protein